MNKISETSCIKRVLHIMPGHGGGISSHVRNMVQGIDNSKVIIDVASFTNYPQDFVDVIKSKGGNVHTLKNVRVKLLFENIREMIAIINYISYDAVHLHLTGLQAAYFSVIARAMGINRVIVHSHIADSVNSNKILSKFKYYCINKLTVSVATDLASCSKIASVFRFGEKYVIKNQVMHIPNSIIPENFMICLSEEEKKKYREELMLERNQMVIGHVGYFGYQKNHSFMIKIIKEMARRKIDFVWLFIGDGEYYQRILDQVKKENLTKYVRFLGRRQDIPELYQIMDISVLPSFFEGLPTVTIETQAAGTPTIVSTFVSEESEMGLNLIKRISLNASIDEWIDGILQAKEVAIPSESQRLEEMKKRYFTCSTSATLYEKFINKEILTYNLGDKIE